MQGDGRRPQFELPKSPRTGNVSLRDARPPKRHALSEPVVRCAAPGLIGRNSREKSRSSPEAAPGSGAPSSRPSPGKGRRSWSPAEISTRPNASLKRLPSDFTVEALAVKTDVSSPAECDALIAAAIQRFGRVDILVNNAAWFALIPLLDASPEDAARMLDTNFRGALFCGRALARWTVENAERSVIVNVSSISGVRPAPGCGLYSASKAALNSLDQIHGAGMGAPRHPRRRHGAGACRHGGRSVRFCDGQARPRPVGGRNSCASNGRALRHRRCRAVSEQRAVAACPWGDADGRRRRSALNGRRAAEIIFMSINRGCVASTKP